MAAGRLQSSQNLLHQTMPAGCTALQPCHPCCLSCIHGIQAERDAIQPSGTKCCCPFQIQKLSIAGESHLAQVLQWISGSCSSKRDGFQQGKQAITQQRFTTRESQRLNPQADSDSNQAELLVKTEQTRRILRIGATVRASKIATRRQREPQNAQRPLPLV